MAAAQAVKCHFVGFLLLLPSVWMLMMVPIWLEHVRCRPGRMQKKGAGVLHFPGLAHYAFGDEFALCINAAATLYSHTWLELRELWAELKPSSMRLSFPKNCHTKSSETQIMQWMSWVHTCLLSSYMHWSHSDQLKCQGEPATEEDWDQTVQPQVLISAESRALIHYDT